MSNYWTEVRRRGWRPRPNYGGRAGGQAAGRTDRAPVFPPWGRAQAQFPNRPDPPPRAVRFAGPQQRSYADVVRQPPPRPILRRNFPRPGGSDVRRQPAEPEFGRLVRKMHLVIKMVHHLQNVQFKPGKPEPRMIARMVEVLSTMIKPAAPTTHTTDMIAGNARNWGHNTCLILTEHYKAGIEDLLQQLTGLLKADWKTAFQVAVRWAKRNLPRLPQDVIDHAEALLVARANPAAPPQVPPPQQTGAAVVPQPRSASISVDTGDLIQPHPAQASTSGVQTCQPQTPAPKTTASTMTDSVVQGKNWTESTPRQDSPKEQREHRKASRKTRSVVPTDISTVAYEFDHVGSSDVIQHPPRVRTMTSETIFSEEEEEEESVALPPDQSRQITAHIHQEPEQPVQPVQSAPQGQQQADQELEQDQAEDQFEESLDHFSSPEPERFRPYRHQNTQRKLTDWSLSVHRKWLFIGDSNLCNLPDYFNKNLQVESFPGAHFRHAQALMEKLTPPPDLIVEKIVLSFGINSRGNKSKETTIKNVQGALRSTKRKFPYAEIYIPLVNFSDVLPQEEKDNLQTLNEHLERNMPFLPLLPADNFQTDDDIHWTKETGSAMFEHWMAHLNFGSP